MQKFPMTARGAESLQEELKFLKFVERPRIINAISEARAHGDLKENAEYHAAREQQSFTEGRIQEIDAKLSRAQVIDVTQIPNTGRVVFGATIYLINCDTDETVMYTIVGEDEADLKENKISYTSPIARALIGKQVDDVVEVTTPSGTVSYEISQVEHV